MDRKIFCEELQAALLESGYSFAVNERHEYLWALTSSNCTLLILFEQFDDDFSVEVCEPDESKPPMSFLLLRSLAGAYDSGNESSGETPVSIAMLLVRFFADLLAGDFSIRTEYERNYDEFFDLLFESRKLPDSHVVKQKIARFDISWMDDLRK